MIGGGESTKLAFAYLSDAYRDRNHWIKVRDHHGTRRADEHLLNTIWHIIDKLGYEGFEFNKTRCAFRLTEYGFISYVSNQDSHQRTAK